MLTIIIVSFSNVIIAYALYYFVVSLSSITSELPWQRCNPEWARPSKSYFKNILEPSKFLEFPKNHALC